jgi:hypothetical protein
MSVRILWARNIKLRFYALVLTWFLPKTTPAFRGIHLNIAIYDVKMLQSAGGPVTKFSIFATVRWSKPITVLQYATVIYSQLQLRNSIGTLERCYLAIFVCAFNEPISFEESRLKRYVRMPSRAKLRPIAWNIERYLCVIIRNYNSKRWKSALVEPRSGKLMNISI